MGRSYAVKIVSGAWGRVKVLGRCSAKCKSSCRLGSALTHAEWGDPRYVPFASHVMKPWIGCALMAVGHRIGGDLEIKLPVLPTRTINDCMLYVSSTGEAKTRATLVRKAL